MGSSHACARVGGEFSDTELSCENADVDNAGGSGVHNVFEGAYAAGRSHRGPRRNV